MWGYLSGRKRFRRLVWGFWGWSGCLAGRDGSESPNAAESHGWSPPGARCGWPETLRFPAPLRREKARHP